MLDNSAIDSSIFKEDFTSTTKILQIYSTDYSKAGLYEFEVKVYYDVQPALFDSTTFEIELIEC